ncbi:hypothetical protein [Paracoccus aerodenitrificans]|uniref:hypothetical protein n=1 Tax=Paracoccus aerodenitrificans TaxID=3017781 RepID=UPI0022F0027D|nr:hypothetical protein [Paracoccus aerodenitrificans]WBU63489.1 hypothetical protein PAE61_14160 [Paracoccus aerodenitrificans]
MQAAPRSFSFSDVLRALWRNLPLVLVLSVLGGVGAYFMARSLPDQYSASAKLISDAARAGLITRQGETADETGEVTATSTIVETMVTPVVLGHALDEMSPEVVALLAESGRSPNEPPPVDQTENEGRQALLRTLGQNLQVSNSGRSFVVNLSYTAENPVLAAGAANAVAHGYLAYRLELRNAVYQEMLENLQQQITDQTNGLRSAEQTAQTMRERVRLLSQRSDVWAEDEQDNAIAQNAELYSRQREAEREVDATAVVYERLLLEHRQIQSLMGEPEISVQLFSPAIVPTQPSGFNVKPVIILLGIVTGCLLGLTIGLIRQRGQSIARNEVHT